MRRTDVIAFGLSMIVATSAVAEGKDMTFAIPPASLDAALAAFGAQSGLDVGVAGTGIADQRSPGVRGRMSARAALSKLLASTGWSAVPLAGGGFRLVRRIERPVRPATARSPVPATRPNDIVVTAGKRDVALLRFPGSVTLIDREHAVRSVTGEQGLVDAVLQAPTLQSTALGSGRDKLFIRGTADSSFIGPTQATTGVYFGEVQLAYSGPDPNLKLYDVDRIEVLEGPQGTLYGAGAIGGVIRVAPHGPDPWKLAGSVTAGLSTGESTGIGHEMAGMVNVPIVRGVLAARAVGYRYRDGGYIDDVGRGRRNVNDTVTEGGRLAVGITPGDGWTIEVGGVIQSIDADDLQYAARSLGGLRRRSAIAQPFDADFRLGWATVAKQWDSGLKLVSATGVIGSALNDRFDATIVPAVPLAYDTRNRHRQVTEEVRLSRSGAGGASWVIGASWLHDRNRIARSYGRASGQRDLVGVINRVHSMALFGEATVPFSPSLSITGGARLTRARIDSNPSIDTRNSIFVRGQSETRLDPTIGYAWQIADRLIWFGRYAKGFRTGGLSVAPGVGRIANFDPDSIGVAETGLRLAKTGARGLGGSIALSRASWRHIQADLVNGRGFPFTANVGSGRITGLEAALDWSPLSGMQLDGGFFYAQDRAFDRPEWPPGIRATRLPDTPRIAAAAGISYERPAVGGTARVALTGRYVGRSYLDPVALLNLRQGGYTACDLATSWRRGSVRLDLAVYNLANVRGDRFALGSPFGVAGGDQYTPLRPRSIRIAATHDW